MEFKDMGPWEIGFLGAIIVYICVMSYLMFHYIRDHYFRK